jgi:twitching motility protein PilT
MIDKFVTYARNFKLSDIHVHSNESLAIRVHGDIQIQQDDFISQQDIEGFIENQLNDKDKAYFREHNDLDLAISHEEFRFRVNIYGTTNGPAMVLRKIETEVPDIGQLGLPPAVMDITTAKNGLVLVTGPTGSGKSTTLAAIINEINESRPENIITIEDPIEFMHKSKRSIVSQREVGRDTDTFSSALRASLREDPDVILVGEMRDYETVSLALTAAETGHLVFGTLHTNGAPSTVNRIIDVFPSAQQAQARSQLSQSLRLVVTQQLLKRTDKEGRIAAFEVMLCNIAVSNLIRENKIFQIEQAMQTGKAMGMITMNDCLKDLAERGIIGG